MDLTHTQSNDLFDQCLEEAEQFSRGEKVETRYCYEVFRRALQQGDSAAFTFIYRNYEPQVRRWVYGHPHFHRTVESADYFVQQAVTSFYFAVRGAGFERFQSMAQIMGYLKMCVHSAVMQYWRETQRIAEPLDNQIAEVRDNSANPGANISAMEIWYRIVELLPEQKDQNLAYYAFVLSLKPAEIAEAYPQEWPTAREVSIALYRIRGILRGDTQLHEMLGFTASSDASGME